MAVCRCRGLVVRKAMVLPPPHPQKILQLEICCPLPATGGGGKSGFPRESTHAVARQELHTAEKVIAPPHRLFDELQRVPACVQLPTCEVLAMCERWEPRAEIVREGMRGGGVVGAKVALRNHAILVAGVLGCRNAYRCMPTWVHSQWGLTAST